MNEKAECTTNATPCHDLDYVRHDRSENNHDFNRNNVVQQILVMIIIYDRETWLRITMVLITSRHNRKWYHQKGNGVATITAIMVMVIS